MKKMRDRVFNIVRSLYHHNAERKRSRRNCICQLSPLHSFIDERSIFIDKSVLTFKQLAGLLPCEEFDRRG
jgi:hypothetical protein